MTAEATSRTTSLLEILQAAEHQLDTYKHPNIDEAQERLDQLLMEMGEGSIKNDRIASLTITEDFVYMTTEWSARGCNQSSDYVIPMSVITASDPIQAARVHGANTRVEKAKNAVKQATKELSFAQERLKKYLDERRALDQPATGSAA